MTLESMGLYDREIKRKRDALLLKNAADFPAIVHYWERTREKFARMGGWAEYKRAERQQLFQQPATAHYREHAYEPETVNNPASELTVELARFTVPNGSSGIVRKLVQWISGFSDISNWGDPITGNAPIDGIVWHLRLVPFRGAVDPRLISTSPFMPGQPYPDLPTFRYLWFRAQAAGSDVNFVVPGGMSLRFIARLPIGCNFQIMGRLAGYWQSSEYTMEAQINAKKGF